MVTMTTCRGCGLRISSTARFCFVCRVRDPILPAATRKSASRRKLFIGGGIAALAWVATCVGLWLTFSR
jgi:hypothetical protein